jgi:hypothetical protein
VLEVDYALLTSSLAVHLDVYMSLVVPNFWTSTFSNGILLRGQFYALRFRVACSPSPVTCLSHGATLTPTVRHDALLRGTHLRRCCSNGRTPECSFCCKQRWAVHWVSSTQTCPATSLHWAGCRCCLSRRS